MLMKNFLILLSFFAIMIVAPFGLENAHAIPDMCNYNPTEDLCCGRILNCSFPDGFINLWCGGPQVPIGGSCPF